MKWRHWRPFNHCAGAILINLDGEHLRYTCEKCGCAWAWGMILVSKGERCPVHGTYAQHAAELAGDELAVFDSESYVPFQEVTDDKRT